MSKTNTKPDVNLESWVSDIIDKYPPKVAKKRKKHMVIREGGEAGCGQTIEANTRTVPGIITQRGCCYAGCKGVVIGPVGDVVHITHGPVGCGYYSWLTRRNMYKAREDGKNYLSYCFTTDMQDQDVIFGGEKKLAQAIREAAEIFKPAAISVHSTCPVGLIGDDIHQVARDMEKETGVPVMAFSCEGYKGVSQSAGHHIANNKLFTDVVGNIDEEQPEFTVNILGEYNIGGDAWEIERVFEACGIKVLSTFSGDIAFNEMERAHNAKLNLVMCHRSINYLAEMMETKYGIPWTKVNFIGAESMAKSMRKVAQFFDNKELTKKIEEVLEKEIEETKKGVAEYVPNLDGKTVMLFVGGSRAHHYQSVFKELGMTPVVAGYEFAHRDDYEGRRVIPSIKIDADSKNIEELTIEADPERYMPRIDEEYKKRLEEEGFLSDYDGMWSDMGEGTLVIDDISHVELERLILDFKPDLVCSGIKDKYVIEKFGVPSKQLHNYDYSGPYAGFRGSVNFARDIDMLINNPAWKLARNPWKETSVLSASLNT
jgi:nitrogenase molybdenum-iron protein alpha chain